MVLRIVLTLVAAKLLKMPYLEIIGGCLLLWIGAQLLVNEEENEGGSKGTSNMLAAVRTILLADLVMSLDNVIAVAAAAKGDTTLLVLGLAISIPLVIFGSTLIIKIMDRFPWIVTLGAALIGWVAGETIVSDHVLQDFVQNYPWVKYLASAVGAVLVIAWGMLMQQRIAAKSANA